MCASIVHRSITSNRDAINIQVITQISNAFAGFEIYDFQILFQDFFVIGGGVGIRTGFRGGGSMPASVHFDGEVVLSVDDHRFFRAAAMYSGTVDEYLSSPYIKARVAVIKNWPD
ncbi:hypothetical protein D9M70_597190 [compost metagenome]